MKKYKRGTSLFEYCVRENKTWLLEQFDFDKNWPKTPADYAKASDKRIWFKYDCGHSCLQRIADKTGKNSMGCPTCLNRGIIGRSLLEEHPYYAEMFMVEKNGVTPNDVSKMNGKSFWWKCQRCGNEFKGKVSDVVQGHRVCSECSNTRRSFPEYCLGYYLLQIDKDREINKNIEGYKFDLFLPKYNLVIEYDGYPWHNSKMSRKNDATKDRICKEKGHTLLRIRDARFR